MKYYKHALLVLFCFFALNLFAQKGNQVQDKKHRFTLYGGFGPNYYFNNLVTAKSYVQPWNYSFTARIMWEPEHFIGLGIESGYYQLYTVKYPASYPWRAEVINTAIPLQLVVSMKFLKNCYANISTGQTNLQNKFISQDKGSFEASSWSLADFGITMGYKYPIINRVSVGAETKFFHSSKNEDNNLALVFMVSYRL